MKLTGLAVENFLGLHSLDIDLSSAPVHFFCGANRAGKSSVRDAVRFALCADPRRVSKKGEFKLLVREGARSGSVMLTTDRGDVRRNVRDGKAIAGGIEIGDGLRFVLDANRFGRLSRKERVATLYAVSGLSTDGAAIASALSKRGVPAPYIKRLKTYLDGGFEMACAEASRLKSEATGAWRHVTGEARYGSEKAEHWEASAPVEPGAAESLEDVNAELAKYDESVAQAHTTIGALRASIETAARMAKEREAIPDDLPSLKLRAETLESELSKANQELDEARQRKRLASHEHATTHTCPSCEARLRFDEDGVLQAAPDEAPIPEDADSLATEIEQWFERARKLTQERDAVRQQVHRAEAIMERLDQADVGEDPESLRAKLAEAEQSLQELNHDRQEAANQRDRLRRAIEASNEAKRTTEKARECHQEAQEWDIIEKLLKPDGLPAEFLSAALDPMNAHIARSCVAASWPPVQITPDMEITCSQRPYALLSASEQWRCDAVIAEALAVLSDERLLVLDEVDILDMQSRVGLFRWLKGIVENQELDTVLMMATVKERPKMPDWVATHWLESAA